MKIEIHTLGEKRQENAMKGLISAIEAAKTFNRKIMVVVGAKRQFPMRLFKSMLSESQAESLKKHEYVKLTDGTELILASTYTISKAPQIPILLVVNGWSDSIPKVRKAIGVEKLVVLAPNEAEATVWESTFEN